MQVSPSLLMDSFAIETIEEDYIGYMLCLAAVVLTMLHLVPRSRHPYMIFMAAFIYISLAAFFYTVQDAGFRSGRYRSPFSPYALTIHKFTMYGWAAMGAFFATRWLQLVDCRVKTGRKV